MANHIELFNDHSVCGRCPARCCSLHPKNHDLRAPLTVADTERIVAMTGLPVQAFAELRPRPNAEDLELIARVSPTLAALFAHPASIYLRLRNGSCSLLGSDKRCRLPRRVRPRFCALFPLWYSLDADNDELRVCVIGSEGCQAVRESAADFDAIVTMFRFDIEELAALMVQTYQEVCEHSTTPIPRSIIEPLQPNPAAPPPE